MQAALVGIGYWGKTILPIIKAMEAQLGFKLKWVCDYHKENWREFQERWPLITFGRNFDELLERHKVDAVFIATQPSSHFSLARKCLEKRCHVFIEKPFIGNLDLACAIRDLATSKSLIVMVGYRLLYSPAIQLLKKEHLRLADDNHFIIEATWKNWGKHQAIGVHWDLGSHYIAVINYLLGGCGEVISAVPLSYSESGVVENISLIIKHHNNLSKIDASWNSAVKLKEMTIKTSDKLFCIAHDKEYPLTIYDVPSQASCYQARNDSEVHLRMCERYNKEVLREKESVESMFSDFIGAVRKGKQEISSLSIAISVIDTLSQVDRIIHSH